MQIPVPHFAIISQVLTFGLRLDRTLNRILKWEESRSELVSEAKKLEYQRRGELYLDMTKSVSVDDAVAAGLVASGGSNDVVGAFLKNFSGMLKGGTGEYNSPIILTQQESVRRLFLQISDDSIKSKLELFSSLHPYDYIPLPA